jgi:hypothetical protein
MQSLESERTLVKSRVQEAIYHPTVNKFFEVYVSSGCFDEYCNIIDRLSEPARNMLVDANATQVHKEKSVIPLLAAKKYGFDLNRAAQIGAATEVLWGLSTIADDIFDNDSLRNGQPSIWVQYGSDTTMQYLFETLNATFAHLDSVDHSVYLLAKDYIQEGLDSIGRHKEMNLSTSINAILQNYAERDGFHTLLPIQALGNWENENLSECAETLMLGMSLFNQAGQIANDTSDLRVGKEGIARLNDMRESRVTIAIATLYNEASDNDRVRIEQLFGSQREYSTDERGFLTAIVEQSVFVPQMSRRIVDTYERSRVVLQEHFLPQDFNLVEKWIKYKTEKYVSI